MSDLKHCAGCGADLSEHDKTDLPTGSHGLACPECGKDAYCPCCGDLTTPDP